MKFSALLAVFRIGLAKAAEYRTVLLLTSFAAPALNALIQGFLWTAVYHSSGKKELGTLTEHGMVAYCICAALCYAFTGASRNVREASEDIRSGGLNKFLLRPVAHDLYTLAAALAEKVPIVFIMCLLFTGLTFLLPTGAVTTDMIPIMMAVFLMICGFLIRFFIGLSVSYLAFWLEEVWTFHVIIDISLWFLSGMLVPISILPQQVQSIVTLLPFQFMSFAPASALTGQLSPSYYMQYMVLGVMWVCILWALCRYLWWRGVVRFGAYGG